MAKLFISTDWHLIRKDKETGLLYVRPDAEEILDSQINNVGPEDTFMFLGDLFDDDFDPRDYRRILGNRLSDKLNNLSGQRKIFLRGNNDIGSDTFYRNLGFGDIRFSVTAPIVFGDKLKITVFSHTSLETPKGVINIHGHIHRDNTGCDDIAYYHDPTNCVNICNRERMTFDCSSMDIEFECNRNNSVYHKGHEKPFAKYIQNMAYEEFLKELDDYIKI
jgi:calcineurin-like phosphoesterase family protein